MKRLNKLKQETKKNIQQELKKNISARKEKSFLKNYILYAFLIVIPAEGVNYFFGLKAVQKFFLEFSLNWGLDILFYDALYYVEPYLNLEPLAFLKDWLWLISFVFFAIVISGLHAFIYEKRFDFKSIFKISLFVSILKLLSYSIPYKVYPVFFFFIDFVKKFYTDSLIVFPVCFQGLFIGTEIMVI